MLFRLLKTASTTEHSKSNPAIDFRHYIKERNIPIGLDFPLVLYTQFVSMTSGQLDHGNATERTPIKLSGLGFLSKNCKDFYYQPTGSSVIIETCDDQVCGNMVETHLALNKWWVTVSHATPDVEYWLFDADSFNSILNKNGNIYYNRL